MDRRRVNTTGDPTDTLPQSPFAETLAATPVGPAPGPPCVPRDSPSDPSRREILDPRYTWRDRLGEGGMGEVRLYHDQRLGRDVAMKVMRAEHIGRTDLGARFLREARVQGRIEHPSIVPVYDLGVAAGTPFFTMKRVIGPTLAEILGRLRAGEPEARDRFSRHKLLAAFASVCLAVDFAHAHGVVHRDLKPDNIMLGSYGELYVLDWGIAKISLVPEQISSAPALDSPQTKAGMFFGTLGYMAPEQVDKALGQTDARSDVYALGAILFEILTLEPLHPLGRSDKMVASTLAPMPVRPSARAPGREIPGELDDICVKATAREKNNRFASARDLYAALEVVREKDRDAEQRRAGAEAHAARAIAAAARAEGERDPDAPARTMALREASRALAFDPSHPGALDVLHRLLASPPQVLPPEVAADLRLASQRLFQRVSRGGALLQLSWFLYLPLALWVGIRDVRLYALLSVLFVASAAHAYYLSVHPPADGRLSLGGTALTAATLASLSVVWSPLILVPPVAVAFAVSLLVVEPTRRWPFVPVLTASAIVAVPVLLGWLGVVPPFFAFDGRLLLILPRMASLTETLTLATSAITHVLIVVSVSLWFIHLRSTLDQIHRRLYHHVWQLRQLVAVEPARASRSIPPAAAPRDDDAPPIATTANSGEGRQSLDAPLVHVASEASRYEERGQITTETDGPVRICEDRRIGRQVAMTACAKGDAEPAALTRLARTLARLEHPSIPPIYDMGQDENGAPYVTMRRLRGTTLAHALAANRYSLQRLLETFGAACLAIDYAHAHGVAHRALSSRTVMLGDYGEVYVTGWGPAVEMPAAGGAGEHADGQARLVRADIAALGAILAELLQAPPALPEDDEARPSLYPTARYVAPELEVICSRATRADRGGEAAADRDAFRSAAELQDAVTRFVEGERDVGRRKARAAEHARLADLALERVFAGAPASSRASAMREASQALALDPTNVRATSVLMRLFTEPPRELPPAAEQEMREAAHREQRRSARTAAILYAAALVYLPFSFLQGYASPVLSVVIPCALVAAAIAFWRLARSPASSNEPIANVVFSMVAAGAVGAAAGPLVLVPTIVIGNLGGFLLQVGHKRRVLVVVLGCLAFVGPLTLQMMGVIPPSYAVHGDALAIFPRMVALSTLGLTVVQIGIIVGACSFFRRFRNALRQAEAQVHVNTWQLRQLIPVEARGAVSIAPPAS